MNAADIILTIIISAAVVAALISIVRKKKNGGYCGCEGCPMIGSCGKRSKNIAL